MGILKNITFFLVILKLIQSLSYIKIPEVEINQLKLVLFPSTSLINNGYQQNIINKNFQIVFSQIPQVLISINLLDIQAFNLQNINFQVNLHQINQLSFNVTVQKYGNQQLNGLSIQYLAINNKDAYVKNGTFQFSNQIYNQDSYWVYAKQSFNYQKSNLDFNIWNVSVSVYIIGIDKSVQQTNNAYLSIVSEINYQSNYFEIIFKTRDLNSQNKINAVHYNYIEIYQQKSKSYYSMQTYIEQSINPSYSTNPILSNYGSQAIITPQYNIKIDKIAGILYGFTGFEVSLNYDIRLKIKEAQIGYDSIQQTNTFKFQYQTWADTQIIAAQSQILIFAQINCNNNGTYFLDEQRTCTQNCPSIGYYNGQVIDPIEGNLNYCLQCDKSCLTCDGKTSQNCLSCQNTYYLFQKQCKACPEQCLNCNQKLQCLSCTQKFPYYYENQCFQQQPANTFCDQGKVCKNCYKNCQTCQGTTEKDCLSCYPQFKLNQNQCLCIDNSKFYNILTDSCEIKKVSLFSQSTQQSIQSGAENINSAQIGIQFTFVITQGLTNSGSSLLSQMLTIQKIFYLLLVNIDHPNFLFEFIKTLSKNGITSSYQIANIFQNCFQMESQYYNQTLDYKFAYNNLSSSIIKNSGAVLFIACCLVIFQIILFLLQCTGIKKHILLVYDKLFSLQQIQFLQLLILVCCYSSVIQIIQLDIQQIMQGIFTYIFTICCLVSVILIISIQAASLYLTKINKIDKSKQSIISILMINLTNDTILESCLTRMYMLIFTIIECIIFPIILVVFRDSNKKSTISLTILQFIELLVTIYLRPFYRNIMNIQFIIEQIVWGITFILFSVLCSQIDSFENNLQEYPDYIVILTLVIMLLMVLAIFISPIFQIIQIIIIIKQYSKKSRNNNTEYKSDLIHDAILSTQNQLNRTPPLLEMSIYTSLNRQKKKQNI